MIRINQAFVRITTVPFVPNELFAELGQSIFQCVHETDDQVLFEREPSIMCLTFSATVRVRRERCDDLREACDDDRQEHDTQSNDQQRGNQGQDVDFG